MANFLIMNAAGTGGYVPYSSSSVSDMLSSYGTAWILNDTGSTALYDMPGTNIDAIVSYTNLGYGTVTVKDIAFTVGSTLIGGMTDLNITINQYALSFNNMVVNGGNDTFYGNDYSNYIHAGAGSDVIYGGASSDTLFGDSGNDTFVSSGGNDYIDGGDGFDTASYAANSWDYTITRSGSGITLSALDGNDILSSVEAFQFANGTFTVDQLFPVVVAPPPPPPPIVVAPSLPTVFYGTDGAERIDGNYLGNVFYSGAGRDVLAGNGGSDTYVFSSKPAKSNVDTIIDFRADDTFALDDAVFKGIGHGGSLKSSAFYANMTGKAHDASDRIIQDKDSGKIYYDVDGTGSRAGVLIANIDKNLKLSFHDFHIV